MTKAERTRSLIIERTAPVFNSKGFDGTSLHDLTAATGLTKGALYGHFEDKESIAVEAFKYAVQRVKTLVASELSGLQSYQKQLGALVDFFAKYVTEPPVAGGCPLLNTAIEADDHRTSMRRHVGRELVSTVSFIQELIEKGMASKEFKKTNSRELAYVLFCLIEGALMFSRVERSKEPMNIAVRHCKRLIDQITIS